MKYDLLVFIGRFQPLHLGHQRVIESALGMSKHVMVMIGGLGKARTSRNPFTFEERQDMISRLYPDVRICGIHDHTYNDTAWVEEVQSCVNNFAKLAGAEKIGLIGCAKDHTSYYLKMFPEWGSEAVEHLNPLNATSIRKMFYEETHMEHEVSAIMDHATAHWMFDVWKKSENYQRSRQQYIDGLAYIEKWGEGPHLTADALVQVGGNVLLIERGDGGGLALPGGFLNKYERFEEGALRELREETRLRVPVPVLKGSIKARRIFDDPHRSERGRIVTECFYIKLENETSLPEVRGSDDAKEAGWFPISELREADFFEDHYHIIKTMLGLQ